MHQADWKFDNKVEIEAWLTKASKGRQTDKNIKEFWETAEAFNKNKEREDDDED